MERSIKIATKETTGRCSGHGLRSVHQQRTGHDDGALDQDRAGQQVQAVVDAVRHVVRHHLQRHHNGEAERGGQAEAEVAGWQAEAKAVTGQSREAGKGGGGSSSEAGKRRR